MTMLTNQLLLPDDIQPSLELLLSTCIVHQLNQLWESMCRVAMSKENCSCTIFNVSQLWLAHPDQQAGFFSIENPQAGPP